MLLSFELIRLLLSHLMRDVAAEPAIHVTVVIAHAMHPKKNIMMAVKITRCKSASAGSRKFGENPNQSLPVSAMSVEFTFRSKKKRTGGLQSALVRSEIKTHIFLGSFEVLCSFPTWQRVLKSTSRASKKAHVCIFTQISRKVRAHAWAGDACSSSPVKPKAGLKGCNLEEGLVRACPDRIRVV